MRVTIFGAVAALLCAGGVSHAAFMDTEPNNNLPSGADHLGVYSDGDATVTVATLFPNDVDWFKIEVDTAIPGFLTTITFPLTNPNNSPDTYMAVFDSDLNMLDDNDDANGFGSAVRLAALPAGVYFIAVTGFPDFDFDGGHSESGMYALTVSFVIPASGAGALSACAGLTAVRRRRSRA